MTVEYVEYERGCQVQLKRLFVWDSGEIMGTLYEAYPPYDDQKDEGFRRAYRGYVEELSASYGPIKKGRWDEIPGEGGLAAGLKDARHPVDLGAHHQPT